MQMTKEAKAYQKSAWIIRLVFLLAGLMIAGGGIWYVAITGIIGRKSWDFGKYGLPPAIPGSSRRSCSPGRNHCIFQNALLQLQSSAPHERLKENQR